MTQYKWTHETPRVRPDGTRIGKGQTFEPTDHELRTWGSGRRQRIVETDGSESTADEVGSPNEDVAAGLGSLDNVGSDQPDADEGRG